MINLTSKARYFRHDMIHRVTRQQALSENLRPVRGLQIQQFSVRLSLTAHLSRFTPDINIACFQYFTTRSNLFFFIPLTQSIAFAFQQLVLQY